MPEDRADVLIITALREEFEAAREAGLAGIPRWEDRDPGSSAPYLRGEYAGRWSVALARPTAASGRSAGPITTTLADRLRPSCLAMCGVCGGNPEHTALGDVVVAEIVYEWDEGKLSPQGFTGDHRPIPLDPRWVRAAQNFEQARLPSYRAATEEEAKWWLLECLLLGQDARRHLARDRYFPPGTWRPRLEQWTDAGLVARDEYGSVILTDDGARLIRRHLYDDIGGPQQLPFGVLVAPMASGSAVVADGTIWTGLAQMGMRKITAMEMEAATIATVAREREIPRWLVAKGVMDHADVVKDDRYKRFAARASAEVLFALLDALVPELRRRDAEPPAAGGSFVHINGDGNVFNGPIAGRDIHPRS
jgi:nucleoside phosphorylase